MGRNDFFLFPSVQLSLGYPIVPVSLPSMRNYLLKDEACDPVSIHAHSLVTVLHWSHIHSSCTLHTRGCAALFTHLFTSFAWV